MTDGTWPLSTLWPIILFPVRLETRVFGAELRIRVIPDAILADTHEPELTTAELAAGEAYWQQATGADPGTATAAWRALAAQLGAARAAWVARVVRQSTLNPRLAFQPAARPASWTRVPYATVLPTRWMATGLLGDGQPAQATGLPITSPVPLGPDPAPGGLALPDWMRDFGTAEGIGMGLRLPLTPDMQQQRRLDLLLVYGVDESGDAGRAAQEVSELFDAQYYTGGLSYIRADTPTSNTEAVSSGWDRRAQAYTDAYRVQATDQPPAGPQTSAAVLAGALGISLTENTDPPSPNLEWQPHIAAAAFTLSQTGGGDAGQNWLQAQAAVLGGVATAAGLASGAGLTEEATAAAMNSALWAAAPGYFLSQMLAGADGEDWRRPDHLNVIADDAYLRFSDRERLLLQAQASVIQNEVNLTAGEPGTARFQAAWQAAIAHRAATAHLSASEAEQQLADELTVEAVGAWQQIRPGDGFDAVGDWDGAARDLLHDRSARYAYFRWLARSTLPGPQADLRLEDWLAGETAALYGDATLRAARDHFTAYIRPGGALPAIAVGNQPYGVLAVTALDDWAPGAGEERLRAFVAALRALRDTVWLPCTTAVPQLSTDPASVTDAQTTLVQLLAMSPLGQQIYAREHVGPDYVRNLWRFVQMKLDSSWDTATAASSQQLLHDTGIAWTPRLSGLIGAEASALVTTPLVGDDGQNVSQWLAWLASAKLADLRGQAVLAGTGASTPLLYRLLRHSGLREYVTAATRLQLRAGILKDWEHLDRELIDIRPEPPGQRPATVWEQLTRTIILPDGSSPVISDYLDSPASDHDPAAADLLDFRAAVTTLAAVQTADELERNLRQVIDSLSHRLDAWITSIAHRRLTALRQATPAGTHLGGYGWVMNLDWRSSSAFSSDGFLHAPSLPQAVTAAVLNSGYQSLTGGAANPFAVNLDSRRTRLARRILDAVRAGQTAGAVTGYDFERRLQESGAGQYTRAFRTCAPPSTTTFPPADPTSAAASMQPASTPGIPSLTDGLVLRTKWQAQDPQVEALLAQIAADDQQRQTPLVPAVTAALDALNDALDAAADALTVESLHHAINGVPGRAAATLDALARGDGIVPELDFLASPRGGLTVGHRVAFTIAATAPRQPGWSAPSTNQLRAAASPTLEAIAETWLPDPGTVRCTATITPADGQPQTLTIRLSSCDISALDCLYDTSAVPDPGTPGAVPDRMWLAVTEAARAQAGASTSAPVNVTWDRTGDFTATDLTFPELAAACRLARDLLQGCRALRPADLAPLGTADIPVTDPGITAAADTAETTVRSTSDGIGAAATQQQAIRTAANLGIPGAAYAAAAGDPDPQLVGAIAAELEKRVHQLDGLASSTSSSRDIQRLQAAFGSDFLPLPAFRPPNAADLTAAAALAQQSGWADQPAIRTCLARSARVRPRLLSLVRQRTVALALQSADAPVAPLATVQLPAVPGEPWVGGAFDGARPAGPRVQVMLASGPLPDPGSALAGLLPDEWTEIIPDTTQMSGLAYHYQSPLSEPPQAVLVAVSADTTAANWTPGALENILRETIDLAKIRMVDQDALAKTGQLLPAFYIANNIAAGKRTPGNRLHRRDRPAQRDDDMTSPP
ncbi:MAG TPA: hypothetical protein VG123_02505, partial [Streptosporangiaceae bacterium]|nr:hypothetical protein [Streptosporangiaceae bacterium]